VIDLLTPPVAPSPTVLLLRSTFLGVTSSSICPGKKRMTKQRLCVKNWMIISGSLHDEAELYELVNQDSTAVIPVNSDGTTVGIDVTIEAVLGI
jgi:hypothetical protein